MTTSRLDPAATYRLQLGPACTFADAARAVDDIAALGVSHLYLSPVAEAVTGSTHGYDVVRPDQVRAALGGADGLRALCERARDAGLGVIVDLVPNHTSAVEPHRNPWWWSLLAEGRDDPAADVFDVDWAVADGRVVVPALGRPLDEAIAAGELTIDEIDLDAPTPNDQPTRVVRYWERVFPLRADGPQPEVGATPREVADALAAQHYELQFWREPRRNVRRFFTIDDLVAIRPEIDRVFDAVVAPVADLIDEGLVDGVRLDHIDGLADPLAYLDRLRARLGDDAWILVEKIVVGDERLGDAWAADGTTGYEWITLVDHVFTHPDGEDAITRWWQRVTGDDVAYHHHEQRGVRDVLDGALRPDLERVTRSARAVPGSPTERAIVALTVALGRYRTYLDGGSDEHHLAERAVMAAAAKRAAKHLDAAGRDALAGIVTELAGTEPADGGSAEVGPGDEFRTRWQQLTGPALAKGGEDRALYRSMRLSAHNEVGGDPGRWTMSLDAFHDHNAWVSGHLPRTLLASSTHDTKRSEDVRARLLALTAMADEWVEQADAWLHPDDAADLVPTIGGPAASLAVQTAVAAWPIDADRLGDYLVKAGREAELLTSWIDVDDAHEDALRRVARHLCEKRRKEITAFVDRIDPAARAIALAQLVVRLTAPGVPDVYQGAERWLRTLVDPDNRAPLDHDALREVVAAIDPDGDPFDAEHPKAAVMARVLHARRAQPGPFVAGAAYEPLPVTGPHADDAIAFARRGPDGAGAVTVAARFPVSVADHGWSDTSVELPAGEWRDLLQPTSGRVARTRSVSLADLLGGRPAAVLTNR